MKLIMEEEEIQAAVKAYMGTDYDIKDLKVVVGRTKSSTRIEVEVERVQVKACIPTSPIMRDISVTEEIVTPVTPKVHSGPIFSRLEED
jgi:hypothetical protein